VQAAWRVLVCESDDSGLGRGELATPVAKPHAGSDATMWCKGSVMFTHTKASRALAALSDPLVRNLFSCNADGECQTPQHWEVLRS
jgi:hypothetical protein